MSTRNAPPPPPQPTFSNPAPAPPTAAAAAAATAPYAQTLAPPPAHPQQAAFPAAPDQQPPAPPQPQLSAHSCVRCARRKVKCDRLPAQCTNCARHSAECEYRSPPPPRRRKKKKKRRVDGEGGEDADDNDGGEGGATGDEGGESGALARKVQRYERLLRGLGVALEEVDGDSAGEEGEGGGGLPTPSSSSAGGNARGRREIRGGRGSRGGAGMKREGGEEKAVGKGGRLVVENGRTRYLEGPIYQHFGEELRPHVLLEEPSDDEDPTAFHGTRPSLDAQGAGLVVGGSPGADLKGLHPHPLHMSRLWQVYLENVDPVIKIFHVPTTQQAVFEASKGFESVPKGLEALMFAIYTGAVMSLTSAECESMFGEARGSLLAKYRLGVQQSLMNAKFLLSSDMAVLQAFTIFLLVSRHDYDPRSLWNLSGIAVRNGQRMGLHRELDSKELSIFDVEMRRRLWWQITFLDGMSGQLAGSGSLIPQQFSNAKRPLNVNDNDLWPDMTSAPAEHTKPTEMIFCQMRGEAADFIPQIRTGNSDDQPWSTSNSTEEKDRAIDSFENLMELKYLRFTDPLVPIHYLTSAVARLLICKMRLGVHHPRRHPQGSRALPTAERDLIFSTSLKMIEYDNMVHGNPSTQRFLWHSRSHFQFDALVNVLDELRLRTAGRDADRAWEQVALVYANRPELTNSKNQRPVFAAVGNLALKAWRFREAESDRRGERGFLDVPRFVDVLRAQQAQRCPNSADDEPSADAAATVEPSAPDLPDVAQSQPVIPTQQPAPQHLPPEQQQHGVAHFPPPHGFTASAPPPPLPDETQAMNSFELDLSPIDWSVYDELMQDFSFDLGSGAIVDPMFAPGPP